MSIVFYFKYLRQPGTAGIHVPDRLHNICSEIYRQFGVEVEPGKAEARDESGEISVDCPEDLQRAVIKAHRVGTDTIDAVRKLHRDLSGQMEVIYLELPLSEAGTPEICEAVEEDGYFFSGVAPLYSPTGDMLRLQFLNVALDTSVLQIENPFARDLLAFIEEDRRRVQRA
jgi:hypothetical protein